MLAYGLNHAARFGAIRSRRCLISAKCFSESLAAAWSPGNRQKGRSPGPILASVPGFDVKLSSIPNRLFERFEPLCAFCGQDPQFLPNCRCVFAFFSDPPLPFLHFLFVFCFGGEKKALSLSVDLEPIEVIMVIAVSLIRKIFAMFGARCAVIRIFPNSGNCE